MIGGETEGIDTEQQIYFLRSYKTFEDEVAGLAESTDAASLINEF